MLTWEVVSSPGGEWGWEVVFSDGVHLPWPRYFVHQNDLPLLMLMYYLRRVVVKVQA